MAPLKEYGTQIQNGFASITIFGIGSLENYRGPDIFDVKGSVPVLLKIAPQGEKMEGVQNSKQSTQNL